MWFKKLISMLVVLFIGLAALLDTAVAAAERGILNYSFYYDRSLEKPVLALYGDNIEYDYWTGNDNTTYTGDIQHEFELSNSMPYETLYIFNVLLQGPYADNVKIGTVKIWLEYDENFNKVRLVKIQYDTVQPENMTTVKLSLVIDEESRDWITIHNWGDPTYEWAEDYSTATATRVCRDTADHTESETVETTNEITCTATTYTAAFEQKPFGTQILTVMGGKSHSWSEWTVIKEPTYDEDGERSHTCSVCGETETEVIHKLGGSEPEFKVHSLVLSGKIGVNFFIDLPVVEGVDYSSSYMEFMVNGVTTTDPYDPDFMNTSGQYYGFTCYVNSIQMAEPISAVFHYTKDGEEKTVTKTYSIKDYMEVFDRNRDSFDAKTIAVVESIADYGHYIQPFLAEAHDWVVGDKYAEMDKYYHESYDIEAIKSAAEQFAFVSAKNEDVTGVYYSLALDSGTDILVYFRPAEGYTGSFTARVNGTETSAEMQSDGRYLVKIPNISAHKLGNSYNVTVTTDHGEATAKISAMTYVWGMLETYTGIMEQNAAAALYKYYEAANNYVN